MELFPAVLIGGPPNSGKSVLTYNLTQALRERGVQHYVLRAAPDGEGDWASEAERDLMRTILVSRAWTPAFVEHVCASLAHRPLPLIVDAGGRPTAWQEAIFDSCTHAVLLTPDESARAAWLELVNRHHVILLADLRSELHGVSQVTAAQPVLTGVIAGLEWGQRIGGPTFEALVERIARLFAYDPEKLRRSHLAAAPVETAIDLDRLARTLGVPFTGDKATWQPHHLPCLLDYLPEATPVGLYGRGPNWLYAAVALLAYPEPFYQFDARLGWVRPPTLCVGTPAADAPVQARSQRRAGHTHLAFTITKAHLDYTEAAGLTVPPVLPGQGVVLSGKLPLWLYTALALTYVPYARWMAVYQPQCGDEAIVVSSGDPQLPVGERAVSPPPLADDNVESV
jgi:CRISPR-associated protein Csx3